jgi:hypothetical protein
MEPGRKIDFQTSDSRRFGGWIFATLLSSPSLAFGSL